MAMGVPEKGVKTAVHHLEPFCVSHVRVGAMYGSLPFIKESGFVSFIFHIRREGKQL